MLQAVANAFKLADLRKKILFTLVVLVIYRLAAHVPVPGVDAEALREVFQQNQLLGLLDMFSGGAMSNFSVMAMGVYPFITAQIVLQLLGPVIPALEQLGKEGEAGRQRLNLYTHLLTVPLAALQGLAQASFLAQSGGAIGPVIRNFGFRPGTWLPTLATIVTLTAGTMFAIWLGELIDEQGIGNGLSIIIFGGIVSGIPQRLGQLWVANPWAILVFLIITAATMLGIVVVQEGQRRIPVQYAKRVRGTRIYGGQRTHIPLQVNSAGMIPLIFAVAIVMLPGVVASYFVNAEVDAVRSIAVWTSRVFDSNGPFYWILYFSLVVGFTYFYTDMIFRQQDLPGTLRRQGGFIPGIRPGSRTAEYLYGVLRRITVVGALFLGIVAIFPFLVRPLVGTSQMLVTSTGLLIVVGVVLDTMKQLEAQLLMRHYEGFIKKAR
ncbi:MAG: preprotein translocase subunit SecY [Anaerolineales bacterium]|jgi:preprotein translocase subunit SecY|nr:MAG: preprotein translocase subunit SecY [Anaerolineales bacterium]